MARPSVVLPEPLPPTTATVSPAAMSRSTPLTAETPASRRNNRCRPAKPTLRLRTLTSRLPPCRCFATAPRRGRASTSRLCRPLAARTGSCRVVPVSTMPALAQHQCALRIARHQSEIVGDQHHRRAVVAGEPDHQIEHLALRQRVERRGRLVGDQELRLQQHHRRQHDALAHAAGEFVRIGVDRSARDRGSARAPACRGSAA